MREQAQPVRRAVARRSSNASPAVSAATSRSSSLIALAIQVTSWCSSSPRSAVASPPRAAPRDARAVVVAAVRDRAAVRDDDQPAPSPRGPIPRASRGDRTGSAVSVPVPSRRLNSTSQSCSRRGVRNEPAHVLLAAQRARRAGRRVAEDLDARLGALLGRVDEPAGLAVGDLGDDPADAAGDRRPRLPERLGHRQAEALRGSTSAATTSECTWNAFTSTAPTLFMLLEDVDVGIAVRVLDGAAVVVPALGVVVRHRADERELDVREPPASPAGRRRSRRAGPSTGRSARPGSAAAARRRRRTGRRCRTRPRARAPCSSASAGRSRAARCTDRGRPVARRGVLAHVEDRRVVAPERRQQHVEHAPGSASRSRCGRARSTSRCRRGDVVDHGRSAADRGRSRSRSRRRRAPRAFGAL